MTTYAVDLTAIHAAARRIAARTHRTSVMTCAPLDRLAGCSLFFKCENCQKVGAFKFRGACNAVAAGRKHRTQAYAPAKPRRRNPECPRLARACGRNSA